LETRHRRTSPPTESRGSGWFARTETRAAPRLPAFPGPRSSAGPHRVAQEFFAPLPAPAQRRLSRRRGKRQATLPDRRSQARALASRRDLKRCIWSGAVGWARLLSAATVFPQGAEYLGWPFSRNAVSQPLSEKDAAMSDLFCEIHEPVQGSRHRPRLWTFAQITPPTPPIKAESTLMVFESGDSAHRSVS